MSAAQNLALRELPAQEPEKNHQEDTKRESKEGSRILATNTPQLLGTDGTPQNGSSEEGVLTRACESEGSIRSADILDCDLVCDDSNAHKGRY